MDMEIKTFVNKKGKICKGIFINNQLIHSLAGFVQINRNLVANASLDAHLGWLYIILMLLARPVGKDRGTLKIKIKLLAKILDKSLSQVNRNLNTLEKNKYINYERASNRYDNFARIVMLKYPVDKPVHKPVNVLSSDSMYAQLTDNSTNNNASLPSIETQLYQNNSNNEKEFPLSYNVINNRKE